MNRLINMFKGTQGTFIGLILLVAFFSIFNPYFFQIRNFVNIFDQCTVLGVMALGMTAVIIIGGIDLSVGSILALAMMMTGWVLEMQNVNNYGFNLKSWVNFQLIFNCKSRKT